MTEESPPRSGGMLHFAQHDINEKGGTMHPYAVSLKTTFEQNADPVQAAPMKKYMRDQFEYLGIKSPQFKGLMKDFIRPLA